MTYLSYGNKCYTIELIPIVSAMSLWTVNSYILAASKIYHLP